MNTSPHPVTLRKDSEFSGASTLALVDQDGTEMTFCRSGGPGGRSRPWVIWHGSEPCRLARLAPADKQRLLDTLHRCPASLSITL